MKKLNRLINNFYYKNRDNIIGKAARYVKYNLLSLRRANFSGTKGDLKYVKLGTGIFSKTRRIAIELSNICNYSNIHTKCPLNKVRDNKKVLSQDIVYHVLETCKKYNYKGYIAFDVYNEPTNDPRLMMFIKDARKMLPDAKVILQTNGFYLDQTLAEEFEKNGVNLIRTSAYTPKEYERLSKIKLKIPIKVTSIVLDNRMEKYSLSEEKCNKPCFAPLNEILITHDAKLALCCWEWKRENVFGDLNKQSLEDILTSEEVQETYNKLSKGDRFLNICKRCTSDR